MFLKNRNNISKIRRSKVTDYVALNYHSLFYPFTGVRYLTDKTQGNCTILPLTNTSGDATMNFTSQNNVDSYILNLKNPLQLFNLDVNYTYIGQVCVGNFIIWQSVLSETYCP